MNLEKKAIMDNIGDRLRIIRGKSSQKEFADEFDVSTSTYQRFERDVTPPNIEFIQAILKKREDINPGWLILGREPMSAEEAGMVGEGLDERLLISIVKYVDEHNDLLNLKLNYEKRAGYYVMLYEQYSLRKKALGKVSLEADEETVRKCLGVKTRAGLDVVRKVRERFDNLFMGDWQPVEMVFAPAYRRGGEADISAGSLKQAKIIDMGEYAVVVTVELTPKDDSNIYILINVYPSGTNHLPPGLIVTVLNQKEEPIEKPSEAEKETDSMEVLCGMAEPDDNFIVTFNLSDVTIKEKFSGK